MCGRFTLTVELSDIQQDLGIKVDDVMIDWSPSYNISPTQTVLTVNQLGERKIKPMRWGLIPSWAKDESIGSKMINARSETLHEKPSFRKSLLSRRCLILADGFYEWKSNPGGSKIPYYFQIADHSLFLFAGLWDTWQPKKGMPIESCTVITCEANS